MRSRSLHLTVGGLLLIAVLALAPGAGARTSRATAPLTLLVNYSFTGEITVTLPNGTPVGTKAGQGQPTVISAGYYNVELNQPGCVDTPAFIMQGPGVNILDDMQNGEIVTDAVGAFLQPNATYTWRDGSINPPVTYTFATNGNVVGTAPEQNTSHPYKPSKAKQVNSDVVGSAADGAVLGSLKATVAPAGTISLAGPHALGAGRYSLTVTDKSTAHGVTLATHGKKKIVLTGTGFVGRRTTKVTLTAGTWTFSPTPGGKSTTFVVR